MTIKIALNVPIDKFVYHSDLETTILVYFPSKRLNYTAINLFLQKLSPLTFVKFTIFTRTDITLQASEKELRVNTMCRAFTPDCWWNNSTFIFIGDVYCPNTKCSGKFACTKRFFNLWAETIINVRNEHLCARCAKFVLKIKRIPFSCPLVKGVIFFQRVQSQFMMLLEMCCPGKYCFNREKCESLDGYISNPRYNYGCGECRTWLFAHKIPFMLQEHVKTTQTDKTRFFIAKKDERGTQQTFVT